MDLNELMVFTRVVETRSFTAAARLLAMQKSTVSRKVAALAERLGVRLLQRTTRTLGLTDAGQALYDHTVRILADVERAEQAVAELQEQPRGVLRISAPFEFGMQFLGTLIAEFLGSHPEVRAEVVLTDRVVDLIEEGFDVAVRVGPLVESSLVARRLAPLRRWLCASPAYFARHGVPLDPDELARHECLVFSGSATPQWLFARADETRRVPIGGRLVVNNFSMVRDAAVEGLGIAFMPVFQCAAELESGRLVTVLEDWTGSGPSLFAVYPTTRHLAPKSRAFIDFLKERMDPAPWMEAEAAVVRRAMATGSR